MNQAPTYSSGIRRFGWTLLIVILSTALSILCGWLADQYLGERIAIFGSFFGFVRAYNPGIAFSIAFPPLIQHLSVGIAFIAVLGIAVTLIARSEQRRLSILGFGFVIGGGFANIIDRIPDGFVTDFIQIGNYPIFNVSDIFITIGATLVILQTMMQHKKHAQTFSPGLVDLLKVIIRARKLKRRETWTHKQIESHQQNELKKLREFAYTNSPFYKKFHKGLENRPLHELPILTKKELMASWDDIVTDRSLRLKDIDHFLNNVTGLESYKGKYFAFATGGTTGVKGITVFSKDEFLSFFSLTARASGWTGIHLPFGQRPRMAVVQSHLPWHVAGAAGFLKLPFIRTLVLDTTDPLEKLVRELNKFQPHVFGGYASNVHLLALEQIAGRLKIAPQMVITTAETLKKEARKAVKMAWGVEPFEAYGATETAEAASECQEHRGFHIYEDVIILEVVDNNNKPVPPGKYGNKVLVTILWNRTLPLIRYEISDHVKLAKKPCPCGRPFQLIAEVQGREEQVMYLSGKAGGKVRIEPDIFFDSMVMLPIDGWQVEQENKDTITFLILGPHPEFQEAKFLKKMAGEFMKRGAKQPTLKVEYITELRRTKVGKLVTIRAL